MSNNTTTKNHTHFPRAVDLIEKGRQTFGLTSENWTEPTDVTLGNPEDEFYAEVWTDGMDWTTTYWLVYTYKFAEPKVVPLAVTEESLMTGDLTSYEIKKIVRSFAHYFMTSQLNEGKVPATYRRYCDDVTCYVSVRENDKVVPCGWANMLPLTYKNAAGSLDLLVIEHAYRT